MRAGESVRSTKPLVTMTITMTLTITMTMTMIMLTVAWINPVMMAIARTMNATANTSILIMSRVMP